MDEAPAFEEIRGNKGVEQAAIAWIMELERAAGCELVDACHKGAPADVESLPRIIEVKAFGGSNRGFGLWLEVRQVEEARSDPNFFVYMVENVRQGDPSKFTLKVLGGEQLRRLLNRAKEKRYYEVPLPVAEYDSAPTNV